MLQLIYEAQWAEAYAIRILMNQFYEWVFPCKPDKLFMSLCSPLDSIFQPNDTSSSSCCGLIIVPRISKFHPLEWVLHQHTMNSIEISIKNSLLKPKSQLTRILIGHRAGCDTNEMTDRYFPTSSLPSQIHGIH